MKNMKYYYPVNNIDFQQQMMKHSYNMFYNQNSIEPMKLSGVDNNQAMLIKMNSKIIFNLLEDYMRYFAMPELYQRPNIENEAKRGDIFSQFNDREKISNKLENVGVNNIVAAFYIKSVQASRQAESVNLSNKALVNNDPNLSEEKKTSPKQKINEEPNDPVNAGNKFPFTNLNSNMFNDKNISDLTMFTDNHLSSVNNFINLIKDKNYEGIIQKDFTSNIKNNNNY